MSKRSTIEIQYLLWTKNIRSDVLSPEQVLNLYCASFAHTLGAVPTGTRLGVRRRKRGVTIAITDFPATPVRLHNFTAGALTDEGSGIPVVAQGTTTGIFDVAGADGVVGNAKSMSGAHQGFASTDAGLPSGISSRSYGCWFKTGTAANQSIMGWGTITTADARLVMTSGGIVQYASGADVGGGTVCNDGTWHHVVVVEDNAAGDGVKRRLFIDGRIVSGSTVLNSITLAGANRFRIGANPDASQPFTGQIDGAFVYAGALTTEQVKTLYNISTQQLVLAPKASEDHIEALELTRVLGRFDTLEAIDLIDLTVIA